MAIEPEIRIATREDVLYLLAEAAEIEHNLMCCYLYAAFSLKTMADDGLTSDETAMVKGWRDAIIGVAIEEMTHLSLVSNLICALGGRPNFNRPNFPVAAGYHPAEIVVKLAPFDMDTLDHFIFLERPEGSDVADSPAFAAPTTYRRIAPARRVMPSSQDYLTVGHLYRGIRIGLDDLARTIGEAQLFCGTTDQQLGPATVNLSGLCVVKDLASAHAAIDTIVEQGEGAPSHSEASHFSRFCAIKTEYRSVLANKPTFNPARPVAHNPVMRKPAIDAEDRLFIDEPLAASLVDLANALYGQMLRLLVQAFGRAAPSPGDQSVLIDAAIETMQCIVPVAEALTRLPASTTRPGVHAGMTFAMLRNLSPAIEGPSEWPLLSARLNELAHAAAEITPDVRQIHWIAKRLEGIAERLAARAHVDQPRGAPPLPTVTDEHAAIAAPVAAGQVGDIEIASAAQVTIRFDTKRCIHSRFCVLWQPQVYKANVQGPWIDPAADSIEAVVAVAHNCPSGAIHYQRRDGGPDESAPRVNLINLRENGPLALRAEIVLNGQQIGYRATLCRCGASQNKPFCDGSHARIAFVASGEPATIETPGLAIRSGPLDITPQRNGPLRVRGNLEICSGTGRTIKRTSGEALCRCGHSNNKPFCDGSHARAGFVAD